MSTLNRDIVLDSDAFKNASVEIQQLLQRTETLKETISTMYNDISTSMVTYIGDQLKLTSEKVFLKPVEDMIIVIKHVADTLDEIIGTGYYGDVFIKYEQLNQNIN